MNREMSKQLGTCVKQWVTEPGQGALDPCSLTHTRYEIIGLLGPFLHSVRYPSLTRARCEHCTFSQPGVPHKFLSFPGMILAHTCASNLTYS